MAVTNAIRYDIELNSILHMVARRIFPGVGKLGVHLGSKVLQRDPGAEPRWRSEGQPPEADDVL